MGGFKEVSREYGSGEGLSCKTGWISKCLGNNGNVSERLHLFHLTAFLTRKERGICITFLLFAFLGTYAYIYIYVCVFWKEVFLFVSLKRRFNHSYSKHTSYGPRPWSILLLVSFQKESQETAGQETEKGREFFFET